MGRHIHHSAPAKPKLVLTSPPTRAFPNPGSLLIMRLIVHTGTKNRFETHTR